MPYEEQVSSTFETKDDVSIPLTEGSSSGSDQHTSEYDDVSIPITEGSDSKHNSEDDDVSMALTEDSGSENSSEDCSSVYDCESVVSGKQVVVRNGLVRLEESDKLREIIEKKFVTRLGDVGIESRVICVYRNMYNGSVMDQARLGSFQMFMKCVEKKNGGETNVKYAWFGGSKDEIDNIVVHGFGFDNIKKNDCFGYGVVLSADHSPLESVESATADEDGVKHILLCRVLLGKSELVNHGSTQCYPSSDDFQSGVDDLLSPKKLVVWSSQMNTHILPEFVISFKTLTSINRPKSNGVPVRHEKPVSPWIPIPNLIAALSKILSPKAIKEITQFRRSYIEHKICRRDMIRGIREVTGDRLLMMILKDFTQQRRFNQLH